MLNKIRLELRAGPEVLCDNRTLSGVEKWKYWGENWIAKVAINEHVFVVSFQEEVCSLKFDMTKRCCHYFQLGVVPPRLLVCPSAESWPASPRHLRFQILLDDVNDLRIISCTCGKFTGI